MFFQWLFSFCSLKTCSVAVWCCLQGSFVIRLAGWNVPTFWVGAWVFGGWFTRYPFAWKPTQILQVKLDSLSSRKASLSPAFSLDQGAKALEHDSRFKLWAGCQIGCLQPLPNEGCAWCLVLYKCLLKGGKNNTSQIQVPLMPSDAITKQAMFLTHMSFWHMKSWNLKRKMPHLGEMILDFTCKGEYSRGSSTSLISLCFAWGHIVPGRQAQATLAQRSESSGLCRLSTFGKTRVVKDARAPATSARPKAHHVTERHITAWPRWFTKGTSRWKKAHHFNANPMATPRSATLKSQPFLVQILRFLCGKLSR